jgi:hypothetical protein
VWEILEGTNLSAQKKRAITNKVYKLLINIREEKWIKKHHKNFSMAMEDFMDGKIK